ncbi:dipeptide ABC transporter ATP-binding protein [Gluconacetobacter sacchari]|uniref:ABC transporter ATP-binding protein n=2 Tax=Gluconacetobacter sacchari TaxID=92759 RepID=A0A7W4NQJ0_9PROT|nr:ABC transporter ATP-binding protein [Gluconacetobacter sacchari]MBB2162599.1 ABC transporter ATP-binding protein [Gluconacetobacter sacchari]GBQ22747.1 ABC transporter-like protein [Gluconacetobacter sacchari DSM 12717]
MSLDVENLSISFPSPTGAHMAVRDVSFTLHPGRVVALVGESGSGKSVTARGLIGLAGAQAHVTARRLALNGRDLRALSPRDWRALRGREIGMVLQDALVALDPLRPVGREIAESLSAHRWGTRTERRQRVHTLLQQVGIPDPALRARQRPDELSGGLRQRALIASAIALTPKLLIADEPTTALDPSVQAQILGLLGRLRDQGTGLLLISHDLGFVARLADHVIVLHHGAVVEQGETARILGRPVHAYTRTLLDADPVRHPPRAARPAPDGPPLLAAHALSLARRGPDGLTRQILADVGFTLHPGRTLGLIGESGSGKTTTARIVTGLTRPDSGQVTFLDQPWVRGGGQPVAESARRPRRRAMAMIYQDPLGSFDPRWTVRQILADALPDTPSTGRDHAIASLLDRVRLPASIAARHPAALSGGQRQRVAIARAVAVRPALIVCDEPVSALDVSVQAQVLDLLEALQRDLGMAYLFISHDLGVIRRMCDDVLVMQAGRIVEAGPAARILTAPRHAFTRTLLDAAQDLSAA